MKITVTEHDRTIILMALRDVGTVITTHLAGKILAQDPTNDGPEISILAREAGMQS